MQADKSKQDELSEATAAFNEETDHARTAIRRVQTVSESQKQRRSSNPKIKPPKSPLNMTRKSSQNLDRDFQATPPRSKSKTKSPPTSGVFDYARLISKEEEKVPKFDLGPDRSGDDKDINPLLTFGKNYFRKMCKELDDPSNPLARFDPLGDEFGVEKKPTSPPSSKFPFSQPIPKKAKKPVTGVTQYIDGKPVGFLRDLVPPVEDLDLTRKMYAKAMRNMVQPSYEPGPIGSISDLRGKATITRRKEPKVIPTETQPADESIIDDNEDAEPQSAPIREQDAVKQAKKLLVDDSGFLTVVEAHEKKETLGHPLPFQIHPDVDNRTGIIIKKQPKEVVDALQERYYELLKASSNIRGAVFQRQLFSRVYKDPFTARIASMMEHLGLGQPDDWKKVPLDEKTLRMLHDARQKDLTDATTELEEEDMRKAFLNQTQGDEAFDLISGGILPNSFLNCPPTELGIKDLANANIAIAPLRPTLEVNGLHAGLVHSVLQKEVPPKRKTWVKVKWSTYMVDIRELDSRIPAGMLLTNGKFTMEQVLDLRKFDSSIEERFKLAPYTEVPGIVWHVTGDLVEFNIKSALDEFRLNGRVHAAVPPEKITKQAFRVWSIARARMKNALSSKNKKAFDEETKDQAVSQFHAIDIYLSSKRRANIKQCALESYLTLRGCDCSRKFSNRVRKLVEVYSIARFADAHTLSFLIGQNAAKKQSWKKLKEEEKVDDKKINQLIDKRIDAKLNKEGSNKKKKSKGRKGRGKPKKFKGKCRFCHKVGHKEADCWKKTESKTKKEQSNNFNTNSYQNSGQNADNSGEARRGRGNWRGRGRARTRGRYRKVS